MGRRQPWAEYKRGLPERILGERDIGYLDPGIERLLDMINGVPGLATTSTCTGRISLVEGPRPWERGEEAARIVYKTHDPVTPETLLAVMARGYCDLWLRVSPPILHVRASSIECALHLLRLARETGHKHSGIVSVAGEAGIVVEVMSGAQITMPLVSGCTRLVSASARSISEIARLANATLAENRARLERLAEALTLDPGPCAGPDSTL